MSNLSDKTMSAVVAVFIILTHKNILRAIPNWIAHILRRNCLLKHVIDGNMEWWRVAMERRGSRRKQILDGLKEMSEYWKLKEEALDRSVCRNRFGRGYGHLLRQTREWMSIDIVMIYVHFKLQTFIPSPSLVTASKSKRKRNVRPPYRF
jgi:hypothetical protein